MNKLMALTVVIGIVTALVPADVYAGPGSDYWPTWRGPSATGVAEKGNPPLTWSSRKRPAKPYGGCGHRDLYWQTTSRPIP